MSLHHQDFHQGRLLHIGCVCCRPENAGCSDLEQTSSNTVAFPLHGVFIKHHAHGAEVVAHIGQALFFNAGETYRVSHPVGSGDDCLVLRAEEEVLRDILAEHDAHRAEHDGHPFRSTHVALVPEIELQRSLLWHGLRNREASILEVETRGLSLLSAVMARISPDGSRDAHGASRRTRRREQSHAVAVLLADQPERDWNLDELARRVHASPYHLARSFRAALGEPIHRYQLRMRLALALEKILDSSIALTTLAMELGFATPSHFTAAFGRAYGVTPSALRKQARPTQAYELRKILTAARNGAH